MKRQLPFFLAVTMLPPALSAQPARASGTATVEHHYRIKWGSAEEARRFGLLEEHWDVIVTAVTE